MTPKDRIIVALDVDSLEQALPLVDSLASHVGYFKVGLELLTSAGAPRVVKAIHDRGGKLFYDGKFDDIPNTVAGAARAVAALGVAMFDVHACCGPEGIAAAAKAKGGSKLIVVTVLTSFDEAGAKAIFGASTREKVSQFIDSAAANGADGIVCSPRELDLFQSRASSKLLRITPGVRPEWAAANDQKRTMTPGEAVRAGASHLVIGRPILRPPAEIGTPAEAAKRIADEIGKAAP